MGNFLHKAAEATTPFMDKTPLLGKKADLAQDILTPKTGPAPPAYNPANNPGAKLYSPPAGGNPNANAPAGSPPGSNLFSPMSGAGGAPGGYSPNVWEQGSNMQLANPNPMGGGTPGAPAMPPGPQVRPGMPMPGMASGGPPGMATGGMGMPTGAPGQGPQLQQQMAIANMLRNRGPQIRQP
jgi:hypothetical protein